MRSSWYGVIQQRSCRGRPPAGDDPFLSIDDTLINSDEVWVSPMLCKRQEDIMLVGGERVLQRTDDHWNSGGFADQWRRTPSARWPVGRAGRCKRRNALAPIWQMPVE